MKKIIYPLSLPVLLIAICGCQNIGNQKTDFPNHLKNTEWIVDVGGLILPNGEQSYTLSPKNTALLFNFHAIDFLDSEKFVSYNSWECGNDCFTKVYGTYSFTETDRITMAIDSVTKSGYCEKSTQALKHSKVLSFDLVRHGKQVQLIKKQDC